MGDYGGCAMSAIQSQLQNKRVQRASSCRHQREVGREVAHSLIRRRKLDRLLWGGREQNLFWRLGSIEIECIDSLPNPLCLNIQGSLCTPKLAPVTKAELMFLCSGFINSVINLLQLKLGVPAQESTFEQNRRAEGGEGTWHFVKANRQLITLLLPNTETGSLFRAL